MTTNSNVGGPAGYQPALDGVRAVAVTMVLFFHAGFEWMRGGYLGVSIFFTLSGYLITTLLLRELKQRGSVDVGHFFARRLRRLLPPSLLCLALVIVARLLGEFKNVPSLRRELFGAATHVFNWVRITGDTSYTDVFASSAALTSPLEHYWSLAIEEQFYLIWPVALLLIGRRLLRRSSSSRGFVVVTAGAFLLTAVVAVVLAALYSADVAYWSTPTRLAELMAGAALAGTLQHWPVTAWPLPQRASRLALPSLGILLVLAVVLPRSSGPAYTGWMAPIAVVSACMLCGLQGESSLRRLLSTTPFVALGKVSYGVYLFHWPVFVLLRQHGWNLTSVPRFLAALAVTMAITVVSYFGLERPIRRATWRPALTIPGGVATMVAMVGVIALVPFSRGFLEANEQVLDAASAQPAGSLVDLVATPTTVSSASTTVLAPTETSAGDSSVTVGGVPASTEESSDSTNPTTTIATEPVVDVELVAPPSRPVRFLTIGDSTAFYVGQGLAEWAVAHPAHASADMLWCQGCGFVLDGSITSFEAESFLERSREVVEIEIDRAVEAVQPDVVVLMTTVNDIADRQWNSDEGPLAPADPRFVERMTVSYGALTTALVEQNVGHVVWVVPPTPVGFRAADGSLFEPERWDVMRDVILLVAEQAGPLVTVVDAEAWGEATGYVDDTNWRPDGTHLTETSALEMVDRWLAPTLITTALQ